jgi:hypothetical protein
MTSGGSDVTIIDEILPFIIFLIGLALHAYFTRIQVVKQRRE